MTSPNEINNGKTGKAPLSSSTKIKIGVTVAFVTIVSGMLLLVYIIASIVTRPIPSTPATPSSSPSAPAQR